MKKILLMAALALSTLSMSAQDDSKFTVYAGLGMSNVVGSDANTNNAFSYKVGINYDISVTDAFSVIPGIEFANKAHSVDGIDGTINKFYAQIPVLAAYKFTLSDKMKLAVKAGPYFGVGVVGSDIDWYAGGTTNVFDENMFKRFDAGIDAGISLDFSKFSIGLEYTRSFAKLNSDLKAYNQTFGVLVGYRF